MISSGSEPSSAIIEHFPQALVIQSSEKKLSLACCHVICSVSCSFMTLPLMSAFVILSRLFPIDFPVRGTQVCVHIHDLELPNTANKNAVQCTQFN